MGGRNMPDAEELLWAVRHRVYAAFAECAAPPTAAEVARQLAIPVTEAAALYRELHARHALYLEPGTDRVRMANPFSAVPTPFAVSAGGRTYWANCAWDAFGIPAALYADAEISAQCAFDGALLRLQVRGTTVSGDGGLVHFLLPCRRWYDDLVFT